MRSIRLALLLLALFGVGTAYAVQPDEMLKDPKLEARARMLSSELRCMVCQNQSIDDSNAPLAHDLRVLVRERLTKGDTNQQVLDFLVARYGEFVLLKPRFNWHTALLWSAPLAVLLIGIIWLLVIARRRTGASAAAAGIAPPLTDAEKKRVAEMLERSGEG